MRLRQRRRVVEGGHDEQVGARARQGAPQNALDGIGHPAKHQARVAPVQALLAGPQQPGGRGGQGINQAAVDPHGRSAAAASQGQVRLQLGFGQGRGDGWGQGQQVAGRKQFVANNHDDGHVVGKDLKGPC